MIGQQGHPGVDSHQVTGPKRQNDKKQQKVLAASPVERDPICDQIPRRQANDDRQSRQLERPAHNLQEQRIENLPIAIEAELEDDGAPRPPGHKTVIDHDAHRDHREDQQPEGRRAQRSADSEGRVASEKAENGSSQPKQIENLHSRFKRPPPSRPGSGARKTSPAPPHGLDGLDGGSCGAVAEATVSASYAPNNRVQISS